MAITAGLLVKGGIALGSLGLVATGVYFMYDYSKSYISKYEMALINFLEKNDTDIVFDVKKGDSGDQDLTEGDISFSSGQPQNVTVSAMVTVSGTSNSSFKKSSGNAQLSDPEMQEIKKLNNGNWTWKCKLSFSRGDEKTVQEIDGKYKNRIFATGDKGLFGILKKDLSSYSNSSKGNWTKEELKREKVDFVRKCGFSRGTSKNKEINGQETTSDLTITVNSLNFQKKDSVLVPSDQSEFDFWFKDVYSSKNYHSAS